MSRNTRVSLPFWVAVPFGLAVVAGWAVYVIVMAIPWVIGWAMRERRAKRASGRQ